MNALYTYLLKYFIMQWGKNANVNISTTGEEEFGGIKKKNIPNVLRYELALNEWIAFFVFVEEYNIMYRYVHYAWCE